MVSETYHLVEMELIFLGDRLGRGIIKKEKDLEKGGSTPDDATHNDMIRALNMPIIRYKKKYYEIYGGTLQ